MGVRLSARRVLSTVASVAFAGLLAASRLVAGGGGSAQDTAVQVKDGQAKTKPEAVPQKNGRAAAPETIQMTLRLYDGGRDPFLSAKRSVTKNINGFDALRSTVSVEFTTFAPNLGSTPPFPGGPFVDSLAGVRSSPPRFWMLYVDGRLSDVGIGAIKIERDVVIEWRLEEPKGH